MMLGVRTSVPASTAEEDAREILVVLRSGVSTSVLASAGAGDTRKIPVVVRRKEIISGICMLMWVSDSYVDGSSDRPVNMSGSCGDKTADALSRWARQGKKHDINPPSRSVPHHQGKQRPSTSFRL